MKSDSTVKRFTGHFPGSNQESMTEYWVVNRGQTPQKRAVCPEEGIFKVQRKERDERKKIDQN